MAENSIIHDRTPIQLRDCEDKRVIWFGSLVEFELANGFDDAESACLRSSLLQSGRFLVDGIEGMSRRFVVEVNGRFALFIVSQPGHETRRFDRSEHAIAIATLTCTRDPLGFAAVITDLETSESIWQYSPPTFHVRPIQSAA